MAPAGVGLVGGCGGNRLAVWMRGGGAGVLVGFGVLVFFFKVGLCLGLRPIRCMGFGPIVVTLVGSLSI